MSEGRGATDDGGRATSGDRLCRRLGLDVPVVQSGMGGVAGPDLAAAVCEAGGLGILAALRVPPDRLREQIRDLRSRTGRPFGVNIWLHEELRPPVDPADLDPGLVAEVQAALDQVRARLDLPPASGPLDPVPDLVDAAIEVMVEERIPVFSAGVGLPDAGLVERFHEVGAAVMAMVVDADDARLAVELGVDVVVAQGLEAGGHRSVGTKRPAGASVGTGTISLVPAVRDAIGGEVPLVAAGGIVDGRGLAAALVLGADGVLLGTRFVATAESTADPAWKAALLGGGRATTVTDALTGQWARALRNDFVDRYRATGARTLPGLLQAAAAGDVFAAARAAGDAEMLPLYAGEGSALLRDLPPAAEVVARIVAEAEQALGRRIGRSSAGP